MKPVPFDLFAELAINTRNGWSIGSLGVAGEFTRDPEEPAKQLRSANRLEIMIQIRLLA